MTNEIPALSISELAGLRRVAAQLLRDASAAEDIVQETWMAASRAGAMPAEARRGWLMGVVRNLARNELRDRARRHAREQRAARHEALDISPSSVVEEQDVHRLLHQGVASLDEPLASALRGRFFEDQSTAELAKASGMSESLIRHRIRSGLEQLRTRLGSSMGDTRTMGLALIGAFDWKTTDVAGRTVATAAPAATFAWAVGLKWVGAMALAIAVVLGLRASLGASDPDLELPSIEHPERSGAMATAVGAPSEAPEAAARKAVTVESTADGAGALANLEQEDDSDSASVTGTAPVQRVRVIDHAGAPVPAADIYQRGSAGFEHAAKTGPDGAAVVVFTERMLEARSAGRGGTGVGLVARAPAYAESTEYFVVTPAPGVTSGAAPLTLQLPGPGQTLTGVVFGTDGRPLAGALVVVDPLALENGENREPPYIPGPGGILQRRLTRRATTGADGSFRLPGLTQTAHPILVTKDGHRSMQVYAGELDRAESSCEIRMTVGGGVRGVVRNGSGEPAAGVWVGAEPLDVGFGVVREVQTDGEGRFELNHLGGGRVRLRAQSDGGEVAALNVDVREEQVQSVQLDLAPVPSFTVSLVDTDGKALRGFGVGLSQPATNWNGGIRPTNGDGQARFVGYPDGELAVRILKRGIQSPLSGHSLVPVDEGTHVVVSPRDHAALGKLSGSVLVDSQAPPPLSRVRINRVGIDSMMTTPILDASGRFEVLNLPRGTYELMLQTPSRGLAFMATIELNGTDYELGVVDLAPTGTLSIEWGWPVNQASSYQLVQRYTMDADALNYDHFIAEGAAPPPSEIRVFEGDYEVVAMAPSGEVIRTTCLRVRPDFRQVLRVDSSDRVPGAFDITLESAPDQRVRLEVHSLDVALGEDAALDGLSEAELAKRLSADTRVHTLYSAAARESVHRFGCDVDRERRWVFTTQLASGKRFTFAMPRPEPEQSAWYPWRLGDSGAQLREE